eukprot:jgi/Bigna1/141726/aug1.64_g16434
MNFWTSRMQFIVNQGLPQGATESPVPLALFINDPMERLRQRGCGVQFANTRRPGLFFADDIAQIAATPLDIEPQLSKIAHDTSSDAVEDLQARWDKSLASLLSGTRQQPDESTTKDLLHLSLDQADALRSSWGHNTGSILHRIAGCSQPARGFDTSVNLDQTHPKLVDLDLHRRVRASLSSNGNLCRSFCSFVKPDTPICKLRAWAKSHIGRPASRLFECHLDAWHDNSGVLLKLQLRAGTCETEERRAEVCNLPPSSSVCPLHNAEVVQTVNHLIHHCTHLNAERNKLLSRMRSALGPGSSFCSSFFDAPDSAKTKVLLGAPSDDPNADRHVDMAFRKFLLRVEVLRRQCFAASVIATQ